MTDLSDRIGAALQDSSEAFRIVQQGDMVAIIMPAERAHPLRVALHPTIAGDTPSAATQRTREGFVAALSRVKV